MAKVLALNLGSATLKAGLFLVSPSRQQIVPVDRADIALATDDAGRSTREPWTDALERVAAELLRADPVDCVVHRVVHGGGLRGPIRLHDDIVARLNVVANWAPAHQSQALQLVAAAERRWPQAESWALFDTDWHHSLPPVSQTLPITAALRSRGMRRYGFHGLAFASAYRVMLAHTPDSAQRRIVLAHLGGGSSLCAVNQGQSIDTSMELTPLSGLPMSTRCGSLDPGVVLAMQRDGMDAEQIELALTRQSGLLGIAGQSGDMRSLLARNDSDARLALEYFAVRVAQGIASMVVSLGGLDDLVFSGGIGSHAMLVRQAIVERLAWVGVRLNTDANQGSGMRIDGEGSRCRAWVITVDEEYELAAGMLAALGAPKP